MTQNDSVGVGVKSGVLIRFPFNLTTHEPKNDAGSAEASAAAIKLLGQSKTARRYPKSFGDYRLYKQENGDVHSRTSSWATTMQPQPKESPLSSILSSLRFLYFSMDLCKDFAAGFKLEYPAFSARYGGVGSTTNAPSVSTFIVHALAYLLAIGTTADDSSLLALSPILKPYNSA